MATLSVPTCCLTAALSVPVKKKYIYTYLRFFQWQLFQCQLYFTIHSMATLSVPVIFYHSFSGNSFSASCFYDSFSGNSFSASCFLRFFQRQLFQCQLYFTILSAATLSVPVFIFYDSFNGDSFSASYYVTIHSVATLSVPVVCCLSKSS